MKVLHIPYKGGAPALQAVVAGDVQLSFGTASSVLPQGQAERDRRTLAMVKTMDEAGFGNCTNYGECQAHCPKSITLDVIAKLNRDYLRARVKEFFSSTGKPSKGGE